MFSFISLIFLLFNRTYTPLISRTELCNSLFLLVNIALFLFISLSKTSSSCIFSSSWFNLWDLGFLEEVSAIFSSFPSLGFYEGNSSYSVATCSVRSSFALKIWPNCWKLGLRDGFGPSNMWHLCINWKIFLYIDLLWTKTFVSFLKIIFIFSRSVFQKHV